jgi:hypothetical protein
MIPSLGDRLALKGFCQKDKTANKSANLLEKLRAKITMKKGDVSACSSRDEQEDESNLSSKARLGNQYAYKATRLIELGWIHNGRNIPLKKGGGTRRVRVRKTDDKDYLETAAINLFFPTGSNNFGNISDCEVDVTDGIGNLLLPDDSVGGLYDILRIYLSTTSKIEHSATDIEQQAVPQMTPSSTQPRAQLEETEPVMHNQAYFGRSLVACKPNVTTHMVNATTLSTGLPTQSKTQTSASNVEQHVAPQLIQPTSTCLPNPAIQQQLFNAGAPQNIEDVLELAGAPQNIEDVLELAMSASGLETWTDGEVHIGRTHSTEPVQWDLDDTITTIQDEASQVKVNSEIKTRPV